jgi:hypothetical protein
MLHDLDFSKIVRIFASSKGEKNERKEISRNRRGRRYVKML